MVVAASRAGALGILDLTRGEDRERCDDIIPTIAKILKDIPFGVKISADRLEPEWLGSFPQTLSTVIVERGTNLDWGSAFEAIESSGRVAVAEVISRESALEALTSGFEAIVLAGHEGGGPVSSSTSFILLQAVLKDTFGSARVWVRGGIGPRSAAGCVAAGAAGVVLDGALLLARESPLGRETRARIATWDGSETAAFSTKFGPTWRVHAPKGSSALEALNRAAGADPEAADRVFERVIGWKEGQAWPLGQDSAFAADLAKRRGTVGGIVQAVSRAIDESLEAARHSRPLAENSPLATSHRTRYPIAQGPMTRVSDRAEFAAAVAEGGGLPFLAVALTPGKDLRPLLAETSKRLGSLSWGVGLLGFVSPELREEQTRAILEVKPPFALIAGGRPDQAKFFEDAGINTYLHVPSPHLLAQYLREGSRRFVLEGRECGGHVGPRSSLVLWEQAARVVTDAVDRGLPADEIHLLYAGGVHDARSAAFVSAMASPLSARGVRVGVLVGTAYLFTEEAIASGAIVEGFQEEALRCETTVLLETGPGHVVRVCPSPFADRFERERQQLLAEGKTHDQVREALEALNVGRLRVAAKGIDRLGGAGSSLAAVSRGDQRERGLYMIGEAATLRDTSTTIAELHREICDGSQVFLEALDASTRHLHRAKPQPSDVAIIGMSAILPGAKDVKSFWENTLKGTDTITEVPADRWNVSLYYDRDPKAKDKITSKWGGFLPEIPFDPLEYGMPPSSLPSIEPLHLIALEAVRAALDDAGYRDREFPRERTSVILGAGGGASQLAMGYALRSYLPLLDTVIPGHGTKALQELDETLPGWTEDSFPGILMNVASGRIANRFDFGGANFTIDAACGSSLAAAVQAVRELETGASDMVILGGADTVQNPFTYLAFSKTHAFSPRGRCRPFDASADGIVISEGVAVVVLKRLADAERDGDRIYAVIKGTGASSDGRAKGLTAPNNAGQVRALQRAYEKSGIDPATVGYVEAHGTGTAAGDLAETQALTRVFNAAGAATGSCCVGSVKSQIGHTKCAAGLAGLINATLAVYHKVIPPTIGIETPNPKVRFDETPFQLNGKARPWSKRGDATRRAGVSAFGFGGTNFHVVLESHDDPFDEKPAPLADWPAELFAWKGATPSDLLAEIRRFESAVDTNAPPKLAEVSQFTLAKFDAGEGGARLGIVADSVPDLLSKLKTARRAIETGANELHDPTGIDFALAPRFRPSEVAFLFPGQGSQRPGMLGDLMLAFPEAFEAFEAFDLTAQGLGSQSLAERVYPGTAFTLEQKSSQKQAIAATEIAQPAIGAVSLAVLAILDRLKIKPAAAAGHSYGELVALHAAGRLSSEALVDLSVARGRLLAMNPAGEPAGMLAVSAGLEQAVALLEGTTEVVVANQNSPSQIVLSGTLKGLESVRERAERLGVRSSIIPVSRAFHSPLVSQAEEPLREAASALDIQSATLPIYSNTTKQVYPADRSEVARLIGTHVVSPVHFSEIIEAMYADGTRVFLETGPGSVLTSLVGSILKDRPHLAVACEPSGASGVSGFLSTLSKLLVSGASIDLRGLNDRRSIAPLTLGRNGFESTTAKLTASTWMVNGTRARPLHGPAPKYLGPGPALEIPDEPESRFDRPRNFPAHRKAVANGHSGKNGNGHRAHEPVFEAFQSTMRNFLDLQRTATLGFLGQASPQLEPSLASTPRAIAPRPVIREEPQAPIVEVVAKVEVSDPSAAVEARLLEIVKDRTGYPVEMLKSELDLEADLGIDSIKRVEILGTLRDSFESLKSANDTGFMDKLARAATLGAIVDVMQSALRSNHTGTNGSAVATPKSRDADSSSDFDVPVKRRVLETGPMPPIAALRTESLRPRGIVLITDDGRGIAEIVADRLAGLGFGSQILTNDRAKLAYAQRYLAWNAETLETAAATLEVVKRVGPPTAILDLRGLNADSIRSQNDELALARGLFLLTKVSLDSLLESAKQGGAVILGATSLGGDFGLARGGVSERFLTQGTIPGLVKTFAKEWDAIRSKALDFDAKAEPRVVAEQIIGELFSTDRAVEIGQFEGKRITLRVKPEGLEKGRATPLGLAPGAPILITGGARGITAKVALALAKLWRPRLVLIGSTALSDSEPNLGLNGNDDPAAIKAALLRSHNGRAREVKPSELEREYQAFRRNREMRENIRLMREAGASVDYLQVDVRDAVALETAIHAWQREHGLFEGVIHGAGVIEDKLVRDKSLESFERVLRIKLGSALVLARSIDPARMKFTAFFGSISGRFGNRGQSDYAAANDGLNKLAQYLDRRWPGRVVSINWGPWGGIGLGAELKGRLQQQGLSMIEPDDGVKQFVDELRLGAKGTVEVVLAGALGRFAEATEVVDES